MVAPVAAPVWLRPEDVRAWLRLPAGTDDDLVLSCCAAAEPVVQRARPDQYVITPPADPDLPPPDPVFTPDASVYQAGVMMAAKVYRRRNSPAGVESFGESVIYTSTKDAEIARALWSGPFAYPAVG